MTSGDYNPEALLKESRNSYFSTFHFELFRHSERVLRDEKSLSADRPCTRRYGAGRQQSPAPDGAGRGAYPSFRHANPSQCAKTLDRVFRRSWIVFKFSLPESSLITCRQAGPAPDGKPRGATVVYTTWYAISHCGGTGQAGLLTKAVGLPLKNFFSVPAGDGVIGE